MMAKKNNEKLKAKLDLLEKLAVAKLQSSRRDKSISHFQMIQALKQRLHAK